MHLRKSFRIWIVTKHGKLGEEVPVRNMEVYIAPDPEDLRKEKITLLHRRTKFTRHSGIASKQAYSVDYAQKGVDFFLIGGNHKAC